MNNDGLAVAEGVIDSQAMFAATAALPDHLEAAVAEAKNKKDLARIGPCDAIVVLGMGGSGVAGEVLAAVGQSSLAVPVIRTAGYELPAFVSASTLVFAVSFSGNTEETLTAVRLAHDRGASIVAITGGGKLASFAEEISAVRYDLPSTIPQPRAGVGAMVAPLLVCCEELGLLDGATDAIAAAVAQLRRRIEDLTSKSGGVAGEIARRLGRTIPLIYGAEGIGAAAARRWKTQVNENAKAPAFFASQPELCHNEICGFGQSGDVTRQILSLVFLRSDFEHPRIAPRFDLVGEALAETVADIIEVRAEGQGALAQFFDLCFLGDFVSLHLATKEGVDPGPVPLLVELKEALAKRP